MQKEKYYYELVYLAHPDLSEAELKELTDKIEALCSKEKAILKLEPAKRIRLAYLIKKQKEAFLVSVNFQAEPETVVSLKKELDGFNQIIRLLMIKKRIVPEPPIRLTPNPETQASQENQDLTDTDTTNQPEQEEVAEVKEKPKKEKKAKEPTKKKASMEEIEKDLEKILGE